MRRFLPTLLWVFCLVPVAAAQQPAAAPVMQPGPTPVVTTETVTTPQMLQQWLVSRDPRLVAWAAYFAQKTQDPQTMAAIETLVQDWPVSSGQGRPYTVYFYEPSRLAMLAMLDALIQGKISIPVGAIAGLEDLFPVQAAFLARQLPREASQELLRRWFSSVNENLLTKIAAMMLADRPDPQLVGPIVAKSEEHLTIYVVSSKTSIPLSGGGACGDSMGVHDPLGWPPVYNYELSEHDDNAEGELVRVDNDVIGYKRYVATHGHGSCYAVWPLNAVTRHHLIAHFLGVSAKDMPWHPEESSTIVWQGRAMYSRQLGRVVEAEQRKLRRTVFQLRQRGLLRPDQHVMPQFSLEVKCMIKPCPLTP
ncbi:hypothetical protein FTW19_25150 [Terriglobus albidus]|uniref:Uncharacterized protein n=1 Tax=Terriglobus albidus TaxID=1592106 RepID=A0A5B9EKU7_9BACT|nr:hypothetical protein [Terriglobus albidus]QEE31001.1 hypothetical protein FTW19_25150 [Terriglobus albidus]